MYITIKGLPEELKDRIQDGGLFQYTRGYYILFELILLTGLVIAYISLVYVQTWLQAILAGLFMAVIMGQFGFLGHDVAHKQVTESEQTNIFTGEIIWGLILGMSMLWWEMDHNQHHQETNKINHDTQINEQFVFSQKQLPYISEFKRKWILPIQHFLFLPFSSLMYIAIIIFSFDFVIRGVLKKPLRLRILFELILMLLHYTLMYGYVFWILGLWHGLIVLLIVHFIGGLSMGLAFAPNHKGELILDEDEEVNFTTQIGSTRNIVPSLFNDIVLGSLNYQIEHHLFPKLPRPLLPRARVITKQYCTEKNITYHETTLVGSYVEIWRSLRENSRLAKKVNDSEIA